MRTLSKILVALLPLALFAACGDDSSGPSGGGADVGSDTGADVSGDTAPIEGVVVDAVFDGDPHVGQNTLIVTVTNGEGEPVVDATVEVDPQMPTMGHGSSETPVVTNNDDGTYTAFPVTLQMGGMWVITVTAESGGESGSTELTVHL